MTVKLSREVRKSRQQYDTHVRLFFLKWKNLEGTSNIRNLRQRETKASVCMGGGRVSEIEQGFSELMFCWSGSRILHVSEMQGAKHHVRFVVCGSLDHSREWELRAELGLYICPKSKYDLFLKHLFGANTISKEPQKVFKSVRKYWIDCQVTSRKGVTRCALFFVCAASLVRRTWLQSSKMISCLDGPNAIS